MLRALKREREGERWRDASEKERAGERESGLMGCRRRRLSGGDREETSERERSG
jgi:hypothetical protein